MSSPQSQRHVFRRSLFVVVATVALLAVPTRVVAVEQTATLTCSDGTNLTASVDADALAGLVQTVEAMLNYPAGMSCAVLTTDPLVQVPTFGSAALAANPNGTHDFAVGGGQWNPPGFCEGSLIINFAFSAHSYPDGPPPNVGGTLNESIPESQCVSGHFKAMVTCLVMDAANGQRTGGGNKAYLAAMVTQSDGPGGFFFTNGVFVGSTVLMAVQDNGNPEKGTAVDKLQFFSSACPTPTGTANFQILHGNILVHDGKF